MHLRFVAGFSRICHLRELLENRKNDRGFCNRPGPSPKWRPKIQISQN